MSEEEIKKQYANGIVNADEVIRSVIDKFKVDKTSVDIQQLQLMAEYLIYKTDKLQKENEELKEEKERAVGLYAQAGLNVKSLNGMVNELDNKVKLKDKAIEELQKENKKLKEENFDQVYMKAIADYKEKIRKIKKRLEKGDSRCYPGDDGTDFAVCIINKILEEK